MMASFGKGIVLNGINEHSLGKVFNKGGSLYSATALLGSSTTSRRTDLVLYHNGTGMNSELQWRNTIQTSHEK
jgi:hypothetical protein